MGGEAEGRRVEENIVYSMIISYGNGWMDGWMDDGGGPLCGDGIFYIIVLNGAMPIILPSGAYYRLIIL